VHQLKILLFFSLRSLRLCVKFLNKYEEVFTQSGEERKGRRGAIIQIDALPERDTIWQII